MDREAAGDHAAWAVDVHEDVLLRVLGLEEEQLGDDQRGHMVSIGPVMKTMRSRSSRE
jgi:hypothetical protein